MSLPQKRTLKQRVLLQALALGASVFFPQASFSAPVSESAKKVPTAQPTTLASFRQAIEDAQVKLGLVEGQALAQWPAWQRKLFQEEVLTAPQLFIQDYRSVKGVLQVEVNLPGIRNFLSFYAPEALSLEKPVALLVLDPEVGCPKCQRDLPTIKKIAKARLESRGFEVLALTPFEFYGRGNQAGAMSQPLADRMKDVCRKRQASAALWMQWRRAEVDPEDSAHAGDEPYQLKSLLMVVPSTSDGKSGAVEMKHDRAVEVLKDDPLDQAAVRLLSEGFTEIGTQYQSRSHSTSVAPSLTGTTDDRPTKREDEILVQVRGVQDFFQFQSLKAQLQAEIPQVISVEERRLSRGQVVFAVRSRASVEEVRKKLTGLSVTLPQGEKQVARALVASGNSDSVTIPLEIK